ncbi:hypothetical protein EIP86_000317 [Pleurotus ostreatoroseus]|nr:hypothetical protein EIP86_000317 [Pleurotus ostreatoroseus]
MDKAQVTTAADLESRAARITDPGIDLKTRLLSASELRDRIDGHKDAEALRVLPHMIPVLLDCLRSGEPAFQKESLEFNFRRTLLEILQRIVSIEVRRDQVSAFTSSMLQLIRTDNEENGVLCCKIVIDLVRNHRSFTEETVKQFLSVLSDAFNNVPVLVEETLSEDSRVLDPNVALPSIRSFKVLSELAMITIHLVQFMRPLVQNVLQETIEAHFHVLTIESPAQKKAREDYEAMGGFWSGMAPTIKNPTAYSDFIVAQVKILSFLAYFLRGHTDQYDSQLENLLLNVLRMLQDCPASAVAPRKDIMMVFRHMVTVPQRRVLLPHVNKLLDEHVVLGSSLSAQETVRSNSFAFIADLMHHLRSDLTTDQIQMVCAVALRYMHNPFLANQTTVLASKITFQMIDSIINKFSQQDASRLIRGVLDSFIDKLESMVLVLSEVIGKYSKTPKPEATDFDDFVLVEKARPMAGATYAVERPEELVVEYRGIFKTLLHAFRALLAALKKCPDTPIPDGTVISRLFEGCIKCISLFDGEGRDAADAIETLASIMAETNLHVFQEVFTMKMEVIFEMARKQPFLMNLTQTLFTREQTSPTLVAIVLHFLIDRLDQLGEYDDQTAAVAIKCFKLVFGAVGLFPSVNEQILAAHLGKLIMDCFPLAAKATTPTHYFHLLRALFRAIGGGGGRFELLYKEVLPLLPEMLECLSRQLRASEGPTQDLVVELCLTVPLRLTHLLPHLVYLMQPLALALRGNPELVSQGLRTLELCIDNLTPDFLDPQLNTVLRELMEALHSHLRPLPASHHHAHTTIRILGKLGGRNRKLLERDPELEFKSHAEPAKVRLMFSGLVGTMDLRPLACLAFRTLTIGKSGAPYRTHAYGYLEACAVLLLTEGVKGRDRSEIFVICLEGIFDAIHIPELQQGAEEFVRNLSRYVFLTEIRRISSRDTVSRRFPGPLFSCYLDALPHGLARKDPDEASKAQELISSLIVELVNISPDIPPNEIKSTLYQLALRFSSLCLEDSWARKNAGCKGIRIMTELSNLGVRWISDRVVDIVRTLLHVLKDMPYDLPEEVELVTDVLSRVLRVSYADIQSAGDNSMAAKSTLLSLIGIFFAELQGQSPVVRQAAQECISLLSELTGLTVVELLLPHRERMLTAIYTKPLRALPFAVQIGMIESVRYCLSLDPPLPELNDELLRLLHEALALADAEDTALIGRHNPRQASIEITKLRVACIKLLTASMPLTDFFSKQHQTRQRVTSCYFKSLYSPTPEVKQVAHEGLRMVLTHQARLPKELLQTGLRPILMNLADPKRLSIPGLEGLARLLELLTNYFKVEIGHKLLDHFRFVADPQMLQASSRLPLTENEGITKLVRLANIFHLLPSAANIFLESLVNAIVQTEAQMHFSSQSPFSEPLAKYLDRYPIEAIDFFMRHLQFPRHVRTLRSILQANLAPSLSKELVSRTDYIVSNCLLGRDASLVMPGLQLSSDLAQLDPSWLTSDGRVLDAVVTLWRINPSLTANTGTPQNDVNQKYGLMLNIFMRALEHSPRIDLLFEIVALFARDLQMELIPVSQFLYRHVALNPSLTYRRNVLMRFMTWFQDPTYHWSHKTYAFRYIVTPTMLVHASHGASEGLIDSDNVQWFHQHVWIPMLDSNGFAETDDAFKVELMHFTAVVIHKYSALLLDVKKDLIKLAYQWINAEDPLVKHTAYLLAARFFEAYEATPQKFILPVWTGLLSRPHSESKSIIRQALDILAPGLERSQGTEGYPPQWAKTTRRLLAEEAGGWSQVGLIYSLMVKHPSLFFPVRALFIPHVVSNLAKLGISGPSGPTPESRILSLDILQVIFDWEQKAIANNAGQANDSTPGPNWITPLHLRESMISYLLRLASSVTETPVRNLVLPRALSLLRSFVGPSGWTDVTVKLNFFTRALQQNDLNTDANILQAQNAAKVVQVVAAEKPDAWFLANTDLLTQLVRKGMTSDDATLHDALHPIFERLVQVLPIPKEDDDPQSEIVDFFTFVNTTISESLKNSTNLRGTLQMLKSLVQVSAERIQPFSGALVKLLSNKIKDHLQSSPGSTGHETLVRLLIAILEICQIAITYLGEQRKVLVNMLSLLVEKSKSGTLCRYLLEVARDWALHRRDGDPTMKEQAIVLQKMMYFEKRGERGEPLFQSYLELIYEIYTEPTLRRSDLTTRLEQQFLLGCRAADVATREKFMDLLDASVPRSLFSRLSYILGVQNWDALSDHNWIYLALHLLLGSVDGDILLVPDRKVSLDTSPVNVPFTLGRCANLVRPTQRMLFLDAQAAHDAWVSIFPTVWAHLSRREQVDITLHMITLLGKDYHINQAELRPNVVQTLLAGVYACNPPMTLPPHLVKYLAKNYGAWHVAMQILEDSVDYVREDELIVRDTVYDALAETYAELAEDDLFYGLWRRRSHYSETNLAIAFEQCGMWELAANMYETAQGRARTGVIPFSEPEYCLWEDHWVLASEKLQQWDTLYELGRSENNHELMLESAWRIKDWADNRDALEEQVAQLPEAATPRRRVYEAFIALLKLPAAVDKNTEFTRILEDAMQLSLRKWVSLPQHMSAAHVPLLQHFQQFVELQEAVQIFGSLSTTTAQNLEKKSADLKMVLQAWRERLPDLCDDIGVWSDLVAWRQNVFNAINKAYIPLIQNTNQGGANTGTTNTFGYRGYHETAWIINRFAHVARKHDLLDVCFTSLNKIYTLPNIEISEAFLKLREQARCHYQKPGDLQAGLEVINNTNLMYFSTNQKAEFYTLKGMFYAKFNKADEANHAFSQAVQLDMTQAKAWAAWGKFNDRQFKEEPNDMAPAASAVSCYLQAAGLYKNRKSRPLLTRVLWLLSIDDPNLTISRAFDTYKGDAAFWYWITLIPQLCLSISQREVKQARYILLNLAKLYPQALFFQLRTVKEDMAAVKRQSIHMARVAALAQAQSVVNGQADAAHPQPENHADAANASGSHPPTGDGTNHAQPSPAPTANGAPGTDGRLSVPRSSNTASPNPNFPTRPAFDHIEEVGQILKTAFPLLIMSLETIVDQIMQRFKATPEEEIYRLVCMLLQDATQQYVYRMSNVDDDGSLNAATKHQLARLAPNLTGSARKDYDEDFLKSNPSLSEYIQRLQQWREKYEKHLDGRPRLQSLELLSHYLTDFQHGKFDEIEVPGQYTEDKDSNQAFIRIQKFGPKFENCRGQGFCFRRFSVYGHDNSKTSFAVQLPSGKHCRREERVAQLFRTFNGVLYRKKETHKRNLHFHVPIAVPCGPSMRILQNDSSYITLADIYEQFCDDAGIMREDPIFLMGEKGKAALREFRKLHGRMMDRPEYINTKKELFDEVRAKVVPEDVLTKHMMRTMEGPSELWRMRKQFTLQLAGVSFMSYVFCITSRLPGRFHLSRATGNIAMSEMLPTQAQQAPVLTSLDVVPFRYTTNLQRFVGPVFMEGVLAPSMMAIARCLTEPEYDLEQNLCLFARDETMTWLHTKGKAWTFDQAFRQLVADMIKSVTDRADIMACRQERDKIIGNPQFIQSPNAMPVLQTIINLISDATNPMLLMKMGELYVPWF